MKIIICDVGNAACAFITSKNGHTMMIDCGSHADKPNPVDTFKANKKWLGAKDFGQHSIGLLHITHPDDDHVRNAKRVGKELNPYQIRHVPIENFSDAATIHPDYTELFNTKYCVSNLPPIRDWGFQINEICNIPIAVCKAADSLKTKERNNSSIIRYIKANGVSVLFCGDLEKNGWDYLINETTNLGFFKTIQENGVNILVASHHGHESGFSEKLFNVIGKVDVIIHSKDSEANIEGSDVSTKYSSRAHGHTYNPQPFNEGSEYHGKVLTTRSNGTIFIDASNDSGMYSIYTDKASSNHTRIK